MKRCRTKARPCLQARPTRSTPATGSALPLLANRPGSNPYNLFGAPAQINYTFPNTVSADTVSTFWRATTGVKGSFTTQKFGDWDWSGGLRPFAKHGRHDVQERPERGGCRKHPAERRL